MSKDIWKDAVEADWGIAPQKKRSAVPVINAGKLTGPVMRFLDESYLGHFHTRPMMSLVLWVVATSLLLIDFHSGYWVLGLFMVLFTLARGAVGIMERTASQAEDNVHGRIYAVCIFVAGLMFVLGGFGVIAVTAWLDGFFSFLTTDRSSRRGRKGLGPYKESNPYAIEKEDPLFVLGKDSAFGGYGSRE